MCTLEEVISTLLEDSQAFSSQEYNQPNSQGECYCALTPNQTNTVHINFSKASQSSRSWSSVAVHTSRKRVHLQRSPSCVWFQQWPRPVIISTNFFRFLLSIQWDPCKLWKGILKNHFTLPTPLPLPVCSIIIQKYCCTSSPLISFTDRLTEKWSGVSSRSCWRWWTVWSRALMSSSWPPPTGPTP